MGKLMKKLTMFERARLGLTSKGITKVKVLPNGKTSVSTSQSLVIAARHHIPLYHVHSCWCVDGKPVQYIMLWQLSSQVWRSSFEGDPSLSP